MPDYTVPAGLRSITPQGWKTLPEDLDFNFRAIGAGSGGAGALATWFLGSGRQVGADWTAGRILPPATEAAAFILPNGIYWIAGRAYVVDEPGAGLAITDTPEDEGVYHVYLSADPDLGEVFVDSDTGYLPARVEDRARAYLGTITTDGLAVTAVDGTHSDYLQNFQDLAARFGGDDGGGGGTFDASAILARLDDLERRVLALENNDEGKVVGLRSESEELHLEVLALSSYLVEMFPDLARHLRARHDNPGATGNLEPLPDGPADRAYAGGNAIRSAADHAII